MLTERQAWLKIAKACDKPDAAGWFTVVKRFRCCEGVCSAINDLVSARMVSDSISLNMLGKVADFGPRELRSGYRWAINQHGAAARAAFCRKMAALCKPAKKRVKKAAK